MLMYNNGKLREGEEGQGQAWNGFSERHVEVTTTLRVGIVNYLNSRPLAWSFLRGTVGEDVEAGGADDD